MAGTCGHGQIEGLGKWGMTSSMDDSRLDDDRVGCCIMVHSHPSSASRMTQFDNDGRIWSPWIVD